jgi:uncharacterized protein (DUF2062 family)
MDAKARNAGKAIAKGLAKESFGGFFPFFEDGRVIN